MDTRLVLPVDAVLHGEYRILRLVGSGGFGITYEAEDITLGTTVAIKEYYPVDFADRDATMGVRPKSERHKPVFEKGRANFLQEARLLARFEHPSIVRVTRVFEANSTPYMVMRFEQGQSFEDWLRELGHVPTQDELDQIVTALLDALETMHDGNFLHRDIAPDNIIIRTNGTPVLLDFGAARRAVAEMSGSLTGIVKAGYSPHEQYASDSRLQGPWSDIYALGATLYRAVTGISPEEPALRVDEDRMPPAAKAAKGSYRPGFLVAIDGCLKVRHSERPQSIAQLRPMLLAPKSQPTKRLVEDNITNVEPSVPSGKTSKPRHLARRWPAIAAMVTLLAGAYGGYEYRRWIAAETGWLASGLAQSGADAEARRKEAARTGPRQAALDEQSRIDAANARQHQIEIEEAQRRKAIADAAEADARRKAEYEAKRKEEARIAALEEARRKNEEELRRSEEEKRRIAALEEERRRIDEEQRQAELREARRWQEMAEAAEAKARRRTEEDTKHKEDERLRLAAIPDDEKRAEFVRKVQQVLKRSRCYDGALNGRSAEAQEALDKFVENANKRDKSELRRIELAKVTVGDFESWLKEADGIKVGLCAPSKVETAKSAKKEPVAKSRRGPAETRRAQHAAPRLQAANGARQEEPSAGRGRRKWGFHHGGFGGGGRRGGAAPLVDPTP